MKYYCLSWNSFRHERNIYFRLKTKIIKIQYFIWDESDTTRGSHKIYGTIYSRFHFKITQDGKIAVILSYNFWLPAALLSGTNE
jgi:hypothetical protein